jgi:hypothetical protein
MSKFKEYPRFEARFSVRHDATESSTATPTPVRYTSQTAVFKLISAENGEVDSYVLSANGKGYTSGVSYALRPVSSRECPSNP